MIEIFKYRNMNPSSCAQNVLEVIPLIMRSLRTEMRSQRDAELSVPQFRALVFTEMNKGTSLSDLAEHLGLMPPAVSKIVNDLVVAGLIRRRTNGADRRRLSLVLTSKGQIKLQVTRKMALDYLAKKFSTMSAAECLQISEAMQKLQKLF